MSEQGETEDFEAYAQSFVEGLIDGGVKNVVICPGSRSTPLAIALARRAGEIRLWILYDERSAAFFALGMAKTSPGPVALVCTSGTAAANLLPAVIEAKLGRVPIIAVTADRPPESRDFGGAQTIDQIGLFGSHVKWFQDIPVASDLEPLLRYSRLVGVRAAHTASSTPQGPVQVNFSFREPLVPGPASVEEGSGGAGAVVEVLGTKVYADEEGLLRLAVELRKFSHGLIVAGPGEYPAPLRDGLSNLSKGLGWPILADVLSNLRQEGALAPGPGEVLRAPLAGRLQVEQARLRPPLGCGPDLQGVELLLPWSPDRPPRRWKRMGDPDFQASTLVFGDLEHSVSGLNKAWRSAEAPPPGPGVARHYGPRRARMRRRRSTRR